MSDSSIWEVEEFKPYRARWLSRSQELARRKSYYDGSVYLKWRDLLGWLAPRVYRQIKPLYLPLARAVDVDAGIIPGGWYFEDDAPDAWAKGRDTLFDWSRWNTEGVLYIHYGAMYGVSGLKIVDRRAEKRVQVLPIDPACFLLIESGQYDPAPSLALWVETRTDPTGASFEYAEVVSAEAIRTFKNGQAFGFDERDPEYKNELGFVPFVQVKHLNVGDELGEATYQKAIPMLDEVNKLASNLSEIIKKHTEPQWAAFGAEPGDLVKSGDNIWFFSLPEAKLQPVVANVDIPGVLDFIREIRDQVFGSLAELAFDELRKKDQIATATLELQLMELVLKIKRVRPNYDQGLADALRMAARAAASMGVRDLSALDDEELEFDQARPVLPLDPETEMRLEMQELALEREKMALEARQEGYMLMPNAVVNAQQPAPVPVDQAKEKTAPQDDAQPDASAIEVSNA
jgi:hypothetical protein